MIKLYALAALIAAIIAVVFHYNSVIDERDQLKLSLKLAERSLAQQIEAAETADRLRADYLKKYNEAKKENENHKKCVADGTCVVTVRVRVPTACNVPSDANTARTETTNAELDPAARFDLYRLRDGLIELQNLYGYCQAALVEASKAR